MRLPNTIRKSQPWQIGLIAPDFELLDVWALPAHGDRGDFASLVEVVVSLDPADVGRASRALFAARLRLGGWLGWDATEDRPIPGCDETTLRVRLPDGLRGTADRPAIGAAIQRLAEGLSPLYRTDDEWAAEISNSTVHGVLHLAWAPDGSGRYRGELGVYVKPRGRLGRAYVLLIEPFRHLVVYPALMRQIRRAWDARETATATAEPQDGPW